jgi:hypothetical protein
VNLTEQWRILGFEWQEDFKIMLPCQSQLLLDIDSILCGSNTLRHFGTDALDCLQFGRSPLQNFGR